MTQNNSIGFCSVELYGKAPIARMCTAMRNWANNRRSARVEEFLCHDEHRAEATLFMTGCWVEINLVYLAAFRY